MERSVENQITTFYMPRCCPNYMKRRTFYEFDANNRICTLYRDRSNFHNILQED